MFANLKNKLIEEVKASPSKFQQFAAAVSSSASTTPSGSDSTTTTTTANENFFSITEEDTPQNSPYKPLKLPPGAVRGRSTTPQALNNGPSGMGAIPRVRKLSSSSMASDVSFRLPTYESPPVYHLQSDLESNCSELEDTASTAKLDVITKEQLYDAYKKSLERYHKYRCRYTDLAKKYKDLERDSTKARSVLVETQEKAIRRISELREQCSLEQQAKAHLEEALRMEMDDMQCKMQAYHTKLKLLGENPENITATLSGTSKEVSGDSLIDFDDKNSSNNNMVETNGNSFGSAELASTAKDINAVKTAQLEKELQEREREIVELTAKMQNFESTITQLRKQEEENALLLAQTKQAIHSELENKESEVKKLTDTIKKLQSDLQASSKKESHLSGHMDELKDLKEKFKTLQEAKQETDAKAIATEHMLNQLKEQYATKDSALTTAEDKLAGFMKENEQRLQDLRQQNAQLNEMVQRYQQNEVSLAEIDNELNRTKNENDNLKTTISENELSLHELKKELGVQREQIESIKQDKINLEETLNATIIRSEELGKQLQEVIAIKDGQEQKVKQLESELRILNEQSEHNESETITALKAELHRTSEELCEQLNVVKEQLANKEKELKSNSNKLAKQKKQHDNQQNKIREQNDEIEKLKVELNKHEHHLEIIQTEANEREKQTEVEKNALKTQITNILQEITQMEEQMQVVQQSHNELEKEKLRLEQKIENMQKQAQDANDGTQRWRDQLTETEDKLRQVETKLQNVESENSQLAEKNCLLEEKSNRLEKLLAERERCQGVEEANANETRLKLEKTEDIIQKLNEKMSQVLDENSRMQNSQELMDHDYRTMQDKLDALEKEKMLSEDALIGLQDEAEQLRERKTTTELRLRETVEQLQQMEEKFAEEKKRCESTMKEVNDMSTVRERLEMEKQTLSTQLNEFRAAQSDDEKLKNLLQERQRRVEELEKEIFNKEESTKEIMKAHDQENMKLKGKIQSLGQILEELKDTKTQHEQLKEQFEKLNQELAEAKQELGSKSEAFSDLEVSLKALESTRQDQEPLMQELQVAKEEIIKLKCDLDEHSKVVSEKQDNENNLQTQLETAQEQLKKLITVESEIQNLNELEQSLRAEMISNTESYMLQVKELEAKLNTANEDIETLHESNDAVQVKMDQVNSKHELEIQNFESTLKQLQEENEKLHEQVSSSKVNEEKLLNYEQLQLENEYLNKHVKQLEEEVTTKQTQVSSQLQDEQDLREKLQSIQCELYVLRENAQKHEELLEEKQREIDHLGSECNDSKEALVNERAEIDRQAEHIKYITEQNDAIQNELLHRQHQLVELEQRLQDSTAELDQVKFEASSMNEIKTKDIEALHANIEEMRGTIERSNEEIRQNTAELQAKAKLHEELDAMRAELAERSNVQDHLALSNAEVNKSAATATSGDAENLRRINETLQCELEDLKHKSTAEIAALQQEIEDMQSNAKHMAERLLEVERLRAGLQAQQLLLGATNANAEMSTDTDRSIVEVVKDGEVDSSDKEQLQREKAELEGKLQQIMSDVREVSNRNMFLEQQCENYLILEQSNERLKLQNAKLSRQLDETLVSMQHNEGITANTEFEYLKNIMFQYLTGSANGNNETLVKVISAVLKFSPQQTQVALEKEHQRRSLLSKIL